MAAARVWPELARHPRRCDRPGRRGAAGGRAPVKEQASAGEAPRRQPAQDSSRRLPPHRHGSPQGPARRSGPAHRGGTAGSTRSALATGAAARVRERAGGASSWRRVGKGGRVATEAAGGRAGSRRALRRSGCRVGGGCVRGASPGSAPPRPAAPRPPQAAPPERSRARPAGRATPQGAGQAGGAPRTGRAAAPPGVWAVLPAGSWRRGRPRRPGRGRGRVLSLRANRREAAGRAGAFSFPGVRVAHSCGTVLLKIDPSVATAGPLR